MEQRESRRVTTDGNQEVAEQTELHMTPGDREDIETAPAREIRESRQEDRAGDTADRDERRA